MALSALKYDGSFAGAEFIAKEYGAQVMTAPGKGYGTVYTCDTGDYAISTGYYYVLDEYYYFQTTTGMWVIYNKNNPMWSYRQGVEKVRTYTQTQAQVVVDKIIKCNKHIVSNNLLCARFASRFTAEQQKQIRELQNRVKERNEALISDGVCTNMQMSYPKGYVELAPYMDSFMAGEAIGISEWAVIVIVAVVIASLSTAAYYMYKSYAEQAEQDVKFSDDLTRILQQKLTPEEYAMLLDETKGIVTKVRIKQSISTGSKTALFVGIVAIVGGLVAMKQLKVI